MWAVYWILNQVLTTAGLVPPPGTRCISAHTLYFTRYILQACVRDVHSHSVDGLFCSADAPDALVSNFWYIELNQPTGEQNSYPDNFVVPAVCSPFWDQHEMYSVGEYYTLYNTS